MRVALVHDYLAVRGGAERVAIALTEIFPGAPLYTSLYDRSRYPELVSVDVRPSLLNRIPALRQHYRAALPLLAAAFGRMDIDADVVVCSSSGWAHGAGTEAPKVMYCYNPARWLYQQSQYASTGNGFRLVSKVVAPALTRWDRRAVASCAHIFAVSRVVAERIGRVWHRDAEVLPPPVTFERDGPQAPLPGVEPGFVLAVSRLLGYKNVREVVASMEHLPDARLVVVGDGPIRHELEASAPPNVSIVGAAAEEQLRWAYAHSVGLVSASYEDFGLTPVEAALFGKPSALLNQGGFLDTGIEGTNAVFFDSPEPRSIASAIRTMVNETWQPDAIRKSAERFSRPRFGQRMHQVVTRVAEAD